MSCGYVLPPQILLPFLLEICFNLRQEVIPPSWNPIPPPSEGTP